MTMAFCMLFIYNFLSEGIDLLKTTVGGICIMCYSVVLKLEPCGCKANLLTNNGLVELNFRCRMLYSNKQFTE